MNRAKIFIAFTFLSILLFIASGCSIPAKSSPVIYLIPKNYEGAVVIFYDQKDGVEPTLDEKDYVFTVPNDGVLKVTIGATPASGTPKFFLVDENDERTEIELLYPLGPKYPEGMRTSRDISTEESDNKIFAMVYAQGNFNTASGIVRFRNFLVCKNKDLNYLYAEMQRKITNVQRTFPR